MKIDRYDVLVIGGGVAGLSVAAESAKQGLKVSIVEKDSGIASTIRTSGASWLSEIEKLGIPSDLYNPISKFGLCSFSVEKVFETPKAEGCVFDVRRLYQYLAHQAVKCGADLFLQTKVDRVDYDKSKSAIMVSTVSPQGIHVFRGDIVVDASGFSTVVGCKLGLTNRPRRFGTGAECEAYAEKVDVEKWNLMIGRAYSPVGYAWIFPVNESRVRIGVGVGRPESKMKPLDKLISLLENRPGPIKKLGRIVPLEFHYGLVPNDGPRSHTVWNRILLVGDSAGQLNPLFLEGIRFAIRFGRMAGKTTKRVIDDGDGSDTYLREYERSWKKEVWNDFQVGLKVQKEIMGLSDQECDREMSIIIGSLTEKEILELLKGKFSTLKTAKLAARHPRLMKTKTFSALLKTKLPKISS